MRFREDVSGISGDASGSAVVFGSSLLAKKDMCFLGHAIHGLSIINLTMYFCWVSLLSSLFDYEIDYEIVGFHSQKSEPWCSNVYQRLQT